MSAYSRQSSKVRRFVRDGVLVSRSWMDDGVFSEMTTSPDDHSSQWRTGDLLRDVKRMVQY